MVSAPDISGQAQRYLRSPDAARGVVTGSLLGTKGALAKLAISRPELKLDQQSIEALQKIFSRHYREFARFEAEMATAKENQDGSVTIQIPAFPNEAATLLEEFLADVSTYYRGATPASVREALKEMYAGYTNELGTAGLDLTVRISEDPNYAYDLSRKVVFMERGRVIAIGETTDVLTKERLGASPYAEISRYFPKASI